MNAAERKGKECQSAALHAFNLHDLHAAYPLYMEAETYYRAAFRTPGDRVFFMQGSAVRCLGELIEQRPGLTELYGSEAKRYLAEWTEDTIRARISPSRLEEALAFRLWIELNLEASIFHDANLAAEAGHFDEAQLLFDRAINRFAKSTDPERDAIIAIARSRREMLVVKKEKAKRRVDRDLKNIARAYLRAGRALCLRAGTTSTQADILSRRRYSALSEALNWRAADSLNQQSTSNAAQQKCLEDSERFLHRATDYARRAQSKGKRNDQPASLVSRLAYSHQTVRESLALMRFMLTGDDQHFATAVQAWEGALRIANALSEDRRETIFPRRFYSLKDLELEKMFLKAARAFRNAQWPDCVAFLQDWINGFPLEYRWSWRYSNVMVRLLGASVVAKICASDGPLDHVAVRQQIRDLGNFARTEPIGSTGRYFADEIIRLQAKNADEARSAILEHLCPYFLLDSRINFYDHPVELDPFESLPNRIARGLSQPAAITKTQFDIAKVELLASIEALLGYVCDYDAQWLPTARPLPEPGIRAFLRFCEQFGWARRPECERLLNELDAVVAHCEAAATAKEFATLYEEGRQVVGRLLKFAPLKLSIERRFADVEQRNYVDATPDWCLDRTDRESIRISVKSKALLPIEPGEYYLPPPWRKGTRLFYLVDPDDNSPLFPVRFKPRWDYWDRALRNILFWLPGGVTYAHLERAVELAAKSIPDGDEKPSPKVGALIVKDGEVIAEAFRNEYGRLANMHAEETALDKCNKRDLTGAIAITTLEPCVAGRRNSKTTCAHLLLQAGIKHVIIGMLDPDVTIRGTAEGLFRKNGASVYYFPTELRTALERLNSEFIEDKEKGQFQPIYHFIPKGVGE